MRPELLLPSFRRVRRAPGGMFGAARLLPLRLLLLALLPSTLTGVATPLWADEPVDPVRLARLVEELGAPAYLARRAADAELARLGPAAIEALESAAERGTPEQRLRAARLLKRIRLTQMWQPTRLPRGPREDDLSLADHLDRLETLSGNSLTLLNPPDMPALSYVPVPFEGISQGSEEPSFWQTLDALCRAAGCHVRPNYPPRPRGFVILADHASRYPLAYSGPFRAHLSLATRRVDARLRYEQLAQETRDGLEFRVQAMWEDRFDLAAYQPCPTVVTAVTDRGETLRPAVVSGSRESRRWFVAGPEKRQLAASIQLSAPTRPAQQLTRLVLDWELMGVADYRSWNMSDPAVGRVLRDAGVEWEVIELTRQPDGRRRIVVEVRRGAIVVTPPECLHHETQLEVLDVRGETLRVVDRHYTPTAEGLRVQLRLPAETPDSRVGHLRLRLPLLRSSKRLRFTFHDVPLPEVTGSAATPQSAPAGRDE